MYDHHLLDMIELGVENFKSLQEFKTEKVALGTKPCLLFSGQGFDRSPEMKRLKNLLIDFFRGPEVTNIRLEGVEHCLQFTCATEGLVHFRSYKILLKRSSTPRMPRVELEEIGPSMDLVLRRTHLASDDLFQSACKQVKNAYKPKKVKNVEEDAFGSTLGTVHLPSQNLDRLQTRKMKGLKEEKKEKLEKLQKKKAKAARSATAAHQVVGNEEDGGMEVAAD